METLLDCVFIESETTILAIKHIDTNELSVIIPDGSDTLDYLGLEDCYSIPIGGSVEVTDSEGERHIITRL